MSKQAIKKGLQPEQPSSCTSRYSKEVCNYLSGSASSSITAIGNIEILKQKKLALFCSTKCLGDIILQAFDVAEALRDAGITVIGGFHSPMEREVLTVLLRSQNPVIVCPARGIEGMRMHREYKKPLDDGRLLLLSPFEKKQNRPTVKTSLIRNRFVAAIADKIFIAHASPNSKTEKLCREIITWDKPLFTLESEDNKNLIDLGVTPVKPQDVGNVFLREHE